MQRSSNCIGRHFKILWSSPNCQVCVESNLHGQLGGEALLPTTYCSFILLKYNSLTLTLLIKSKRINYIQMIPKVSQISNLLTGEYTEHVSTEGRGRCGAFTAMRHGLHTRLLLGHYLVPACGEAIAKALHAAIRDHAVLLKRTQGILLCVCVCE